MVIKFGYTHSADRAVFGTCWFDGFTGWALIVLFVHYAIVVTLKSFHILVLILRCDFTGRDRAGLVIHPKANTRQNISNYHHDIIDNWIWHVFEDTLDCVSYKPVYTFKFTHQPRSRNRTIALRGGWFTLNSAWCLPASSVLFLRKAFGQQICIKCFRYEKMPGIVLKNKLRNLPKMPGSFGLTQMSRQTAAPIKK